MKSFSYSVRVLNLGISSKPDIHEEQSIDGMLTGDVLCPSCGKLVAFGILIEKIRYSQKGKKTK